MTVDKHGFRLEVDGGHRWRSVDLDLYRAAKRKFFWHPAIHGNAVVGSGDEEVEEIVARIDSEAAKLYDVNIMFCGNLPDTSAPNISVLNADGVEIVKHLYSLCSQLSKKSKEHGLVSPVNRKQEIAVIRLENDEVEMIMHDEGLMKKFSSVISSSNRMFVHVIVLVDDLSLIRKSVLERFGWIGFFEDNEIIAEQHFPEVTRRSVNMSQVKRGLVYVRSENRTYVVNSVKYRQSDFAKDHLKRIETERDLYNDFLEEVAHEQA